MSISDKIDYIIKNLQVKGAQKVAVSATNAEVEELQYEYDEIDLIRSYIQNKINIKAIIDNKQSDIALNQLDNNSIENAIQNVLNDARNSLPDSAYDIAPLQPAENFSLGPRNPDKDRMFEIINNFLADCRHKYPHLKLEGNIKHNFATSYYRNSNGTSFTQNRGSYTYISMFTTQKGDISSSLNYTYGTYLDLNRTFWELPQMKQLIKQSDSSLQAETIPGTFSGDLIITPSVADEFLSSLVYSQLAGQSMITGSSLLKGKLGEKVLSDKINLISYPNDPRLAGGFFYTSDGFKVEKTPVFSSGILDNYFLSLYPARKTGLPVSKAFDCFELSPGNESLQNLIADTKKGILLVRFSGGYPSSNTDFSGVAKNSFYIEDGKIKFPVKETMISGNLLKLFNNVTAISKETINNGHFIMPWIKTSGITISA